MVLGLEAYGNSLQFSNLIDLERRECFSGRRAYDRSSCKVCGSAAAVDATTSAELSRRSVPTAERGRAPSVGGWNNTLI